MTIYTDTAGRVISVDKFVEDAKVINVDDNETFKNFSEVRKLCYYYFKTEEGSIFYPAIRTDIIDMLDRNQEEVNNLNSIIDLLILESLEGDKDV